MNFHFILSSQWSKIYRVWIKTVSHYTFFPKFGFQIFFNVVLNVKFATKCVTYLVTLWAKQTFCDHIHQCNLQTILGKTYDDLTQILQQQFSCSFSWWITSPFCADFGSTFARRASAVTPSKKTSVNTNRKSTTRFPINPIWTSYVVLKPPKGGLKTQSFQNLNIKLRYIRNGTR